MKYLAIFVTFSLLVAFACAQSDRAPFPANAVSLGTAVVDANSVTTTRTGTVFNQTLEPCRINTHSVSVQNSGPLNSGSYFQITISPRDSAVDFEFGLPTPTNGDSATSFEIITPTTGTVGNVAAGSTITFSYYCQNYPSNSPLQVRVWTNAGSVAEYDLTVTQYTTNVRTIPASGTLVQSTGVVSTEATDNIGGQNFVHYYHSLGDRSMSERGSKARLVVEATNWNTGTAHTGVGTAKICVSFSNLVSSNTPVSGPTYSASVSDLASFTPGVSSSPCPIWCTSTDISAAEDAENLLPIVLDLCDINCDAEHLWIGIVPPSATETSIYTVGVRFLEETLAPVGTIPAGDGQVQGVLDVDCITTALDDFSCEAHYSIAQPASTPTTPFGPFFSLELFAVNNGEVTLDITENGLGGLSACAGCAASVGGCGPVSGIQSSPLYCWSIIHPCQYDRTKTYTATLTSSGTKLNPDYPIEYALNTFVGSWTKDIITPNSFNKPSFGTVKPGHYYHYEVTFTQSQLNEFSHFQVELYSLHEEDSIEFFWRFGAPAGRSDECYDSDGMCSTNQDCADHDAVTNTGHCRFLFLACDVDTDEAVSGYSTFAGDTGTGIAGTSDFGGLKIATLRAGTYYFAVRGKEADETNVQNEYTYTILWNLQGAIRIFDSVPVNNAVYFLEESQQYVFDLPQLDNLYWLRIRTSYVFNGQVTTYINCGTRAGECPCGQSVGSCTAGIPEIDTQIVDRDYECEITYEPVCDCDGDKLYIAVKGTSAGDTFEDAHKPIPYVLTVIVEHATDKAIPYLSAGRAPYSYADSIDRAMDIIDNDSWRESSIDGFAKFYKVSFTNVEERPNDMFIADITVIDGLYDLGDVYQDVFGDAFRSPIIGLALRTYDDCTTHGFCYAGTVPGESTLIDFDPYGAYDHEYDLSQGTCRIALQPCAATYDCGSCNTASINPQDPSVQNLGNWTTTAFDRTKEYYLVVQNLGSPLLGMGGDITDWQTFAPRLFENLNNVYYHLSVQVIEQTPLPLTIDTPVYGHVGAKQYVHFQYDVASAPTNAKLVFEAYRSHNEEETLIFYVNYFDGTGESVWAGEEYDCYGTLGCDARCELSREGDYDVCSYEVSPCNLRSSGTYFLSVSSGTRRSVWSNATFGVHEIDFTISAKHYPVVELLGTATEGVQRGVVREGRSLYYSVTVPSISGNVLGRVLTVELENIVFGDVEVLVTRDAPRDQCGCSTGAEVITSGAGSLSRHVLKRYPCEISGTNTFYITVTGIEPTSCEPVGFVLRAFVDNIVERPVTLVSSSLSGFPTLRYDSPENNDFTVGPRDLVVMTWTPSSSAAGTVMNVAITQDGTPITVPVTLAHGSVAYPSGNSEFGPVPSRLQCTTATKSGDLGASLEFFVDACEVPNTNTKWFLFFNGEQISSETGVISVSIRVIPPQQVVTSIPPTGTYGVASDSTVPVATEPEELPVLGRRVVTSSNINVPVGEALEISITGGPGSVRVSRGVEANAGTLATGCGVVDCPSLPCTVRACAAANGEVWYFGFEGQTANFTISITRQPALWSSTFTNPLQVTPLQTIPLGQTIEPARFTIGADEWKYFSYNVPASESTQAYRVEALDGASGAQIVEVTSAVYYPQFILSGSASTLLNGASASTCGTGAPWTLPYGEQCCYSATSRIFAVLGPVTDGSVVLRTASLVGTAQGSISFPGTSTLTAPVGKVSYYQFTVSNDAGFTFELEVTAGSAEFSLGTGRTGTSQNFNWDSPMYNICYDTTAQIQSFGTVNNGTTVTFNSCNAAASCTGRYVLTVTVNDPLVAVSFRVTTSTYSTTQAFTGSANGVVPIAGTANVQENFSEYKYTFTGSLDAANWVPISGEPLLTAEYVEPKLVFEVRNLRNGTAAIFFDDVSANVPDFYLGSASGKPCGTPSGSRPFQISPDASVARLEELYCDLGCGEEFFVQASKKSGDEASWTFGLSASSTTSNFTSFVDIRPVTVSGSTVSVQYNSVAAKQAVYYKVTYNLQQNSWVDVNLANVVTSAGSISLRRWNPSPNACLTYGAADTLCGSVSGTVDAPGSCTVPAIGPSTDDGERCIAPETDFDRFTVYYRVGFESLQDGQNFTFTLNFQVRTITPILDASATTLSPGQVYAREKIINEGSWQFYRFTLNADRAYSHFDFSVDVIGCLSGGEQLEVYTSWNEAAAEQMEDWIRPNRWPVSDDCAANNGEEVTTGYANNIAGECHVYGGEYRVAIYAPPGSSLFEDGYVAYNIRAELTSLPHIDIYTGCPNIQVFGDEVEEPFVPRYELHIDAADRGKYLTIAAESSDPTFAFTLRASKNANPYPSDPLCGAWTNVEADGYFESVDFDGVHYIDILPCAFETGVWYLYLDFAGAVPPTGTEFSISASTGLWHVPVADLSGDVKTVTWEASLFFGIEQTYKVIVDPSEEEFVLTPTLRFPDAACANPVCEISVNYRIGSAGLAGVDSTSQFETSCDGGCTADCGSCSEELCTIDSTAASCSETICSTARAYFFTVYSPVPANCPYIFEVSAAHTPELLEGATDQCVTVEEGDKQHVYSVRNVNEITISNPSIAAITVEKRTYGCADPVPVTCTGTSCTFDLCGFDYFVVSFETECAFQYGISTTTFDSATIVPIALGVALEDATADTIASITVQPSTPVYTNQQVQYTIGEPANCGRMNLCDGATTAGSVLAAVDGQPTTYYLYSVVDLIVTAVPPATTLGTSPVVVDFKTSNVKNFVITLPAGVNDFEIVLSDVNGDIAGVEYRVSSTGIPYTECTSCLPNDAFDQFGTIGAPTCGEAQIVVSGNCFTTRTLWVSFGTCGDTCGLSFRASVVFDAAEASLTTASGNHNSQYTVHDSQVSATCGGAEIRREVSFLVEVTDILSVSLRNPGAGGASVSFYPVCDSTGAQACVVDRVDETGGYSQYSCQAPSSCDPTFSCFAPGTYRVDITTDVAVPFSYVEYRVVNQWVDLGSSASGTVYGAERHFYKIDAPGSLSLSLAISSGPALRFNVFDGCGDLEYGFQETQVCVDQCNVWIPTRAKHSVNSVYYIELEGKTISSGPNKNDLVEKPTAYTLASKLGTANCAAPSSSGWCASTEFEGVNVWSTITSPTVWTPQNPEAKNEEARCRFEELLSSCLTPTEECRQWLKSFTCLMVFPQCDASGFQAPVCTDACYKVSEVCGLELPCCTDYFSDSVEGSTCVDIPPPPPPATVSELPQMDVGGIEYPPSLETPVFDTIELFLPPADQLFSNLPFFKDAVVEENSSSSLVPGLVFCVLAIFALLF